MSIPGTGSFNCKRRIVIGENGQKMIQLIRPKAGASNAAQTPIAMKPDRENHHQFSASAQQSLRQHPDNGPLSRQTNRNSPVITTPTAAQKVASSSAPSFSIGDAVKFTPQFAKQKAKQHQGSLGPDEALKKVF